MLVSSGAVGAGISLLGLKGRPTDLAKLQAVAAVGQTHLIQTYDRTFAKHGRRAAQVLLTLEDVDDRIRYLNVRNTLLSLLEFGAVPIVNENDTVSVDELKTTFGDNDRLAAMVTNLLRAPLLDRAVRYRGPVRRRPEPRQRRKLVSTVERIDERVLAYVRDRKTGLSKGGMASKLEAARIVTTAGENMIIASGRQTDVLTTHHGRRKRRHAVPRPGQRRSARSSAGSASRPRSAAEFSSTKAPARRSSKRAAACSPPASSARRANFRRATSSPSATPKAHVIARGLTNYSSADVERIKGLKSEKIAQVLGRRPYEEVIHRDNLAIVKK